MMKTSSIDMVRIKALAEKLSVSERTIYRLIKEDGFPAPKQITGRVRAFSVAEVESWISSKSQAARKSNTHPTEP